MYSKNKSIENPIQKSLGAVMALKYKDGVSGLVRDTYVKGRILGTILCLHLMLSCPHQLSGKLQCCISSRFVVLAGLMQTIIIKLIINLILIRS